MDTSTVTLYPPQALHEVGGRSNNEDSIFPKLEKAGQQDRLFLVCDGVGGAEKGEVASALVCDYMPEYFHLHPGATHDRVFIEKALRHAEGKMTSYLDTHPEAKDMGTTLTLLSLKKGRASVAWVGDSRVYQVRNGKIIYRTEDHSLVNTLVRQGEITEEEAKNHPQRNVIMRAVHGDDEPAKIDVVQLEDVQPNDFFLLCTDGLLEQVSDEVICQTLVRDADPQQVKNYFLHLCAGKTRDNFSMYLIKIKDTTGGKGWSPSPSEEKSEMARTAPEFPEEDGKTKPELANLKSLFLANGKWDMFKRILVAILSIALLVLAALIINREFSKEGMDKEGLPENGQPFEERPTDEENLDSVSLRAVQDTTKHTESDGLQAPDTENP